MGVLKDKEVKELGEVFNGLKHAVKLIMFTQERECQHCEVTRRMVEEIASLSDRITAEVYDFVEDAELARRYGVDKIPAVIVMGEEDHGIRFYGVPAGYEFTTLVDDIVDVGQREHGLSDDIVAELARLERPVRLQVMITPT